MMKLPVLISVPHAGLSVPPELAALNRLTEQEIRKDGDEGADEIYDIRDHVQAWLTTDVARAFVDVNRPRDDFRKDGVVKTHTCWDIPIYTSPLAPEIVDILLDKYYDPYHAELTRLRGGVKFGIDCHTMAAQAPPVAPDPGQKRPLVCLSNAGDIFPDEWLNLMKVFFQEAFQAGILLNHPFKGGYIISRHGLEMPWLQVELSRSDEMDNMQKKARFLEAIEKFCMAI
ncbi:MAG: N-formylglutamate amidohydrolase [Sedimentisphaerales bacterium]|nr:N-formylglutamate amidohydrolase [Sedimentisphaerales bacterium]